MLGSKIFASLLLAGLSGAKYVVPGGRWYDTDGDLISAHAGGITVDEETGKFWWFGEYKIEGQTEGGGVSVYSSDDLVTWEHHGLALSLSYPAFKAAFVQLCVNSLLQRPLRDTNISPRRILSSAPRLFTVKKTRSTTYVEITTTLPASYPQETNNNF